jgi:hypothetical protein
VEVFARVDLDQQDASAAVCEVGAERRRDGALAYTALSGDHQELELVEAPQDSHEDLNA